MVDFFSNLIGNDYIATAIMSLVPLIELKGGIVFARGAGLDFFMAFLLAYVGSTLVFFPVFFLLRPILNGLKKISWFNKFACKVEGYFESKASGTMAEREKSDKKAKLSEKSLKQLSVFLFVAIPLPMTGVWTGTAVAVFLNMKFKDAILPVVAGNAVAGIIISLLAELCLALGNIKTLDYILYALFGIAVLVLVVLIIKLVLQKPKEQKENTEENGKEIK